MKIIKNTLLTAAMLSVVSASAQTFKVTEGDVSYLFPASEVGEMLLGSDNTLSVMGRNFNLTDNLRMSVVDTEIENNVVSVTYNCATANVVIAGNIAVMLT